MEDPQVSIVIVSFNTRDLLRRCLDAVRHEFSTMPCQVIVVDNASLDGSADMVSAEFPEVHIIRSAVNLGFAAANNRAFSIARGCYVVMLNSDAFIRTGALARAVAHMDASQQVGLAGGRLVGCDDSWQPSARTFPSLFNKVLTMSGLAARYRYSRLLGRADRTWADPLESARVDWVPGAFAIVRRKVLEKVGYFDERFFLYFEEIDLCRRIQSAGYEVWYWPDIVATHVGGASAKMLLLEISAAGSQVMLWRMRSELLYYRKYHRLVGAWCVMSLETCWYRVRALLNTASRDPARRAKANNSRMIVATMRQAWRETQRGKTSPPRPW